MIRADLAYLYPNTGARWSKAEMDLLRRLAGEGADWSDVASRFGRTSEACRIKAIEEGIITAEVRGPRGPRKRIASACVLS